MVRTQIQLTEKQAKALKRLSQEQGRSQADLIRQAVEMLLGRQHHLSLREMRDRAAEVSGKFRSGLKDLSRKHDAYLPEAYSR